MPDLFSRFVLPLGRPLWISGARPLTVDRVSRYACQRCQHPEIPKLEELAAAVIGPRWWAPADGIADAQVRTILYGAQAGYCTRHAVLLGDLVAMAVRRESARRVVLPGTVEIRTVKIDAEPFEPLTAHDARRRGNRVVDRVRRFVAGSALSALVEMDLESRRVRVTLQLADAAVPVTTVIESDRLVHMTAGELAEGLRLRRVTAQPGR